ncbi:holo-ACP synthase [Robiginitomaculum antarcticum]|uniref:holo-ACP synthase n=1 Tax=Robiginitomaculum antarcticum TaxID=437507 RepID=UPI000361D0D7|nr:holo-ACP synthase [Robiginitomaculum antarcticum]
MILGIGTDICDMRRIDALMAEKGEAFEAKVFTKKEREFCAKRHAKTDCLAKRFAAKEALAKALSTGDTGWLTWKDVEVLSSKSGKPSIKLYNNALNRLNGMTPEGMTAKIDLSLSDETPYALAFIVISLIPRAGAADL